MFKSQTDAQTKTSLAFSEIGRDDWIRTSDPLTPSQVRYQAALHPVFGWYGRIRLPLLLDRRCDGFGLRLRLRHVANAQLKIAISRRGRCAGRSGQHRRQFAKPSLDVQDPLARVLAEELSDIRQRRIR